MAGEAAASGLRFFLDRGLGSLVVPRTLRQAGWVLETMDERYGADWSQAMSRASLTGPVMAQWYLDNEAKIVAAALKAAGPYAMAVNPTYGIRRARLGFPPS